ncbi:MAG: glycosyltransferase family 2 protein [Candidatus Brocadiia bacterium]
MHSGVAGGSISIPAASGQSQPGLSTELSATPAVYLTLFVACYNEEANIVDTLDTVLAALGHFSFTWEIIVIDDASSDQSVHRVREYIREHPRLPIRLVLNERNKGLGQNFIEAAFLGSGKYYRLICGDNVEPEERLVEIFRHIGEADMIIPYHVREEGKSLFRRALSRCYTQLINIIAGYNIRYYNGLPVHLRYHVMRWHTNGRGFGFQADMVTRLLDEGFTYKEIPVVLYERPEGTSNALKLKNVLSVAHTILEIGIRRLGRLLYRR